MSPFIGNLHNVGHSKGSLRRLKQKFILLDGPATTCQVGYLISMYCFPKTDIPPGV